MNIEMRQTLDAAPVQYEGTIDGRYFFFHARHEEWRFTVADSLEEASDAFSEGVVFAIAGRYGDGRDAYAASYMPHEEAARLIRVCAQAYVAATHGEENVRG